MPLVALLDGVTVVSVDLPDERWSSIHRPKNPAGMTCVHCDGTMIAKERLIRFFAHRTLSPECPAGRESEAHIMLKLALRDAVLAAGWEAELEFTSDRLGPQAGSDRWEADVLAASPGRQPVALEAQLANQSVFEAQGRTERYLRNGVDVIWFARHRRSWTLSVPAVAVSPDNLTVVGGLCRFNDETNALDAAEAPLAKFVAAYLGGEVATVPIARKEGFISKVGLARFAAAEERRLADEDAMREAWAAYQREQEDRRLIVATREAADPLHVTSALVMKTFIGAGFDVGAREHHGSVDLVRLRGGTGAALAVGGYHSEADFVIHVSERPPAALPPGEGWTDPLAQRFAFGTPAIARPAGEWDLRKMIGR